MGDLALMPDTTRTALDYQSLFEQAPGLYLVLDSRFRIVGASDAYCRATMTERDAIMGRDLFDVFPDNPDDKGATGVSNLRASLERVLLLRKPDAMALQKYDIRRPEGDFQLRYWSPLNTPVLDSEGEVRWIVHRVEDVTELVRLKTEEQDIGILAREQQAIIGQLRTANRQLAESNDRIMGLQRDRLHLASVVESSDDAIITKSLDGTITSWNKSAERIFGYGAEEIVGRPGAVLVPPELCHEEDRFFSDLKAGRAVDHHVTRRLRKDGREIYVSLSVSALRNAAGQMIGISKIARDVTEKRRTEQRLEDLQSELIHLSRWNMMGMMAATLAHELNQPLAAIANYAAALGRILADPGQPPEIAREILAKIVRQRERASQIVERLRKQVARGDAVRNPERLDDVVSESLELVASTIQKGGARAAFAAAEALPAALVDRVQIQQVVINLVRNAVEAMERSDDKRVQISVVPDERVGMIRVDIADLGPGLPKDLDDRLFQPFVTTKSAGMGLGLSICKNIIENHGGRLWAKPNFPRGTVFSFSLPTYVESRPG